MQKSKAQSRAIAHVKGPAMVLAGPGSGKTFVITQRVKSLIDESGISPREILVITFTKAAAQEMQNRFRAICPVSGVTFGTFHAVFFSVLKHAYHYTAADVMGEDAKQQLLRQLIQRCGEEGLHDGETVSELAAEISMVKNERIELEHYYSSSCPAEVFREVYRRYEELHRQQRKLDFDDMLTCTWELLTQRADILQMWQQRWSYILVDEFQDINMLQYEILKLLAAPQNNLFIVGDDDQSIYRFRGAKPEIMLNFPKDYPEARTIVLDQNFRSVNPVITGAIQVIEENKHRFPKKICAVRPGGGPIDLRRFQNQGHESLYVARQIQKSIERGIPCEEIAILVRTNQGAGPFAERLMEFNIPFVMRDILPNVYEHWIAKDLFAYLHLARKGLDRTEFLQVMNRPKRYISRDSIDAPVLSFERLCAYYSDKEWMVDRLLRLEADLRILSGLAPYAAVNYIRFAMQYEEYLKEYAAARRMKPEELTDLLDEIQQGAKPYHTVDEWYTHIEAYKETLAENRRNTRQRGEAVTISTLHAAKGLEFSEVFLVDINEGILPHRRASLEADLEEERRLFYVGMTRAKDTLHLFYIKERYGKAVEPSEFLHVFFD